MSVTIYSKSWCPYCVMAKRLLSSKGVNFKEIDVEAKPSMLKHMMKESGQRTVPQIWVGQHHVGGFDQLSALDRAGKLDDLLKKEG